MAHEAIPDSVSMPEAAANMTTAAEVAAAAFWCLPEPVLWRKNKKGVS